MRLPPAVRSALPEVLLARHGRTEWNVIGRRQGLYDSPLLPESAGVTAAAAAMLGTLEVDGVASSPLGRARATARVFADAYRLPLVVRPELREIDHGSLTGRTDDEIARDFPQEAAARAADRYGYRFPGGEGYQDAAARTRDALGWLAGRGWRRPLVVSHEMVGRTLIGWLRGLDTGRMLAGRHPHHVVYRIGCACSGPQAADDELTDSSSSGSSPQPVLLCCPADDAGRTPWRRCAAAAEVRS